MEELRSTDILDKEIQADARKKAERILAKADADAKQIIDNVDSRVQVSKKEKDTATEEKITAFEKDKKAALPLEKERFYVSYVDGQVKNAADKYIESLSEEKQVALLMSQFEKFLPIVNECKFNACIYGIEESSVKKALEKKLGANLASCKKIENLEDSHAGIILTSEDNMIKCRLTLSGIIEELLSAKRAELADALFGGRLGA